MDLNFELVGRDFLRVLRGPRSQLAFSRLLGYRTNVAYTWESGRRWPTAAEVLRAAARVRHDVRAALRTFFASPPSWLARLDPATPKGVAAMLSEVCANIPIVELARRTGRSRYAVARWLAGAAEPRLPDFLRLFEAASLRLLDFIALFVEPSLLPSTSSAWKMLEAHRRAVYELPFTSAVLRAMDLSDYAKLEKHEPGWIARRIGITRDEEARCLSVLEAGGQILRNGARWEPSPELTVDTRKDQRAERTLKETWAKVGLQRLADAAPGLFSFNVFAVSHRDYERLRELHRNYFRQLRSIVAVSQPSERVVVANVQLFPLDPDP